MTPISGLSIDFGKFVTTAGAEVIESNKNWLYSRSFLFFNIPLLHNGVRAGYKINDMVSVQASAVNGWNGQGLNPYITGDKTFGVSATITAPGGVTIVPTGYFGNTGSGDTRILFDLVGAYAATLDAHDNGTLPALLDGWRERLEAQASAGLCRARATFEGQGLLRASGSASD